MIKTLDAKVKGFVVKSDILNYGQKKTTFRSSFNIINCKW